MADRELYDLSLGEAAALVAARKLSPLELTEACIARAEALDAKLNAYITRTFDTALAEAKVATAAIAAGRYQGPLHGIPFALKDLYETAGVRTTAASKLREEYVPAEDASVVTRLKEAGVVMLGKLNLHEWAFGGTNINTYFPTAHNPWDLSRITGGSSGGSGAALAAGLCLGSLGSDTAGSIRIPASLCGITGLKPTYGRASLRGVVPLSWSLDTAGPMARSAADCALILQAIAGFDPLDPASVDAPVPDYAASLSGRLDGPSTGSGHGLRVGLVTNYFFDEDAVEPEVAAAVLAATEELRQLGAAVEEVVVPGMEEATAWALTMIVADATAFHETRLRDHPDDFGPAVLARLQTAASIGAVQYAQARRAQAELQATLRDLFLGLDLLVCPTSPIVAPPIEATDAATRSLARHTAPFNLAGVPAASVPCGFSSEGLPIGLMIAGRWWEEATVLRAAHAYQQATDWHKRRPALL